MRFCKSLKLKWKKFSCHTEKGRKNLSRNSNALNYNKKDSFFSSLRLIFEKWNIKKMLRKMNKKIKSSKLFSSFFMIFIVFVFFAQSLNEQLFFFSFHSSFFSTSFALHRCSPLMVNLFFGGYVVYSMLNVINFQFLTNFMNLNF